VAGGVAAAATIVVVVAPGGGRAASRTPTGIHKIKHVVFVMQENRSFDSYFGTYPGADGYPRDAKGRIAVCVPDPQANTCVKPYHDTNEVNTGGPHIEESAVKDENGGKMDGFNGTAEAAGPGPDAQCLH